MTSRAGVCLRGRIVVPGDKSVCHRLAMLAAIARGRSEIAGFSSGEDCSRTVALVEALGLSVRRDEDRLGIDGKGAGGLRPPGTDIDAGNSGTTARLGCGLLAAQPFDARIRGDASLSRRPFERVVAPLARMGASIATAEGRLPLVIRGRPLTGIDYTLPVPSAQVKSAVLLAGLFASGRTTVREPVRTRDHTEIALAAFGASLTRDPASGISVEGGSELQGGSFTVPGDFSSAAFFIAAAACLPGSDLVVEGVGLNPTRTGLLDVLREMGAEVTVEADAPRPPGEPRGNVRVRGGRLVGTRVGGQKLPTLIDELPILSLVATQAEGRTEVRGASELRVKESDRLAAITRGLESLGAEVESWDDGFAVVGGRPLRGTKLSGDGDHRMVMTWAMASLMAEGVCTIDGKEQVSISYPGFWSALDRLAHTRVRG